MATKQKLQSAWSRFFSLQNVGWLQGIRWQWLDNQEYHVRCQREIQLPKNTDRQSTFSMLSNCYDGILWYYLFEGTINVDEDTVEGNFEGIWEAVIQIKMLENLTLEGDALMKKFSVDSIWQNISFTVEINTPPWSNSVSLLSRSLMQALDNKSWRTELR